MEYYLNRPCVTYRELVEEGGVMTINQYRHALNRKKIDVLRKGGNGREALIDFDTLPPKIKLEVQRVYGDIRKQAIESPLKKYYEIDFRAQDFYDQYRYDNGTRIKIEKIRQYVANASALNAIKLLIEANKTMRKRSGGTVKIGEVYNDFILPSLQALKAEWGHSLPKSERQLREVLKKYDTYSYEGLISGKDNNDNAAKAKESEQHALIRQLLSHSNNFDYAQVAMMYNEVANRVGWKPITRKTVENFAKENVLLTEGGRRGEKSFDNKLAMQHRRRDAPYPMLMWTLDGWDAELLYQKTKSNKNGHNVTEYHHRPTIVVVLDPFTKYPVGYAIGTHETPDLIKDAVRNALNHTEELFGGCRYRPNQVQADHYSKASLVPFFEQIFPKVTLARVGNAKAKIIEPYFKYLNKEYCQFYNNWSGHGVTAKQDNQPNVEFKMKIRHSIPDWDGVAQQLVRMIESERDKKRDAYLEGWERLPEHHKFQWRTDQYLMYAGQKKERTSKVRGLMQFDINGVEYQYDSFDPEFRMHINTNWNIHYDLQDMSNVLATNEDGTLRFLLQPVHQTAMALLDYQDGDAENMTKINQYNKQLKQAISEHNANDYNIVDEFLRANDVESQTLAKMLMVNSIGQHKNTKSALRTGTKDIAAPKKEKALPIPTTDLEDKLNKYYEEEHKFDEYL